MENRFKNASGARLTQALFYEETGADKSSVIYTLKDQDHEGFPSLYRLYLEMEDVLEYEFANTYLDGWSHWELLNQAGWFKPYILRWRKELELKIRSKALRKLREDATSTSKTANSSNRYLLERGWADKQTKGRPSKDEIRKAAKEQAESTKILQSDFLRLNPTSPTDIFKTQ
jgi:hypothetical protein